MSSPSTTTTTPCRDGELTQLGWLVNVSLQLSSLELDTKQQHNSSNSSAARSGSALRRGTSASPPAATAATSIPAFPASSLAARANTLLATAEEAPAVGGWSTLVALALATSCRNTAAADVTAPTTNTSSSNNNSGSGSVGSVDDSALPAGLTATQIVRWIRTRCPRLAPDQAALRSAVRTALSGNTLFARPTPRGSLWHLAPVAGAQLCILARGVGGALGAFDAAVAAASAAPTKAKVSAKAGGKAAAGGKRRRTASASSSSSSSTSSPPGSPPPSSSGKRQAARRAAMRAAAASAAAPSSPSKAVEAAAAAAAAAAEAVSAALTTGGAPLVLSDPPSPASASDCYDDYDSEASSQHEPARMVPNDLGLELLLDGMEDPLLARMLAGGDDTGMASVSPASALPTLDVMRAAVPLTPGKAAHAAAAAAAAGGGMWDDCLQHLSDALGASSACDDFAAFGGAGSTAGDWLSFGVPSAALDPASMEVDILAL